MRIVVYTGWKYYVEFQRKDKRMCVKPFPSYKLAKDYAESIDNVLRIFVPKRDYDVIGCDVWFYTYYNLITGHQGAGEFYLPHGEDPYEYVYDCLDEEDELNDLDYMGVFTLE